MRRRDHSDDYKVINTKVDVETYKNLHSLAKSKGMTVYNLFQMFADTLCRYMDDRYQLTPEMERAMALFEFLVDWDKHINLADPGIKKEVSEATYFMTARGKKGCRAVHVFQPFMGKAEQTNNIQTIFERMVELLLPERYKRLRMLAGDMECSSILELLDHLIDCADIMVLNNELKEPFEDNSRSIWGRKPNEQPMKTHHHKTVNDDKSIDISAEDMERDMGIRPLGGEW